MVWSLIPIIVSLDDGIIWMIYGRHEYGCKACGRLLNNLDLVKLEKYVITLEEISTWYYIYEMPWMSLS